MAIRVFTHGTRIARAIGAVLALGASAVPSATAATPDATPPSGAVGGVTSPVRDALTLTLSADDADSGLAVARAYLDGAPVAQATLGSGCADADPDLSSPGCVRQVTGTPLTVGLAGVATGEHRLQVGVVDAAGNEATVLDTQITVAGPPPVFTPVVELTVGRSQPSSSQAASQSSAPGPSAATPSDGDASHTGQASASQCAYPRLSMVLDQRPLRISRGRPVLRANARYRFRGTLTCRVGAKRRSAQRGVLVELLNRVGDRVLGKTGTTTRSAGRITMILSYRSSRTLIFRHRSATGTSQVRIPITISHARVAKKPTKKETRR